MNDSAGFETSRYLLVDIAGQMFAIPMSDVVAVQRTGDPPSESAAPVATAPGEPVAAVDLRHLFRDTVPASPRGYAVLLSTRTGTCAVLVDAVYPVRTVDPGDRCALPRLVAGLGCPFTEAVRAAEKVVLVIDTPRLLEHIHRVAPEVVRENDYAT